MSQWCLHFWRRNWPCYSYVRRRRRGGMEKPYGSSTQQRYQSKCGSPCRWCWTPPKSLTITWVLSVIVGSSLTSCPDVDRWCMIVQGCPTNRVGHHIAHVQWPILCGAIPDNYAQTCSYRVLDRLNSAIVKCLVTAIKANDLVENLPFVRLQNALKGCCIYHQALTCLE